MCDVTVTVVVIMSESLSFALFLLSVSLLYSHVQVTIAVLVCGWAHVLHSVYKPWGSGGAMYALQHASLFVTSFVFQMGLLFKVNGVGAGSPTFDALSAVMLLLCVAFLVCWLAVVVVYIPQNVLVQHPKSRVVRRWLGWLPRFLPRLLRVPGCDVALLDGVVNADSDGGIVGRDSKAGDTVRKSSARFTTVNPLRRGVDSDDVESSAKATPMPMPTQQAVAAGKLDWVHSADSNGADTTRLKSSTGSEPSVGGVDGAAVVSMRTAGAAAAGDVDRLGVPSDGTHPPSSGSGSLGGSGISDRWVRVPAMAARPAHQ